MSESWEAITVVDVTWITARLESMMSQASRPSLIFCLRSTVGK
jgi:hypothetical protein